MSGYNPLGESTAQDAMTTLRTARAQGTLNSFVFSPSLGFAQASRLCLPEGIDLQSQLRTLLASLPSPSSTPTPSHTFARIARTLSTNHKTSQAQQAAVTITTLHRWTLEDLASAARRPQDTRYRAISLMRDMVRVRDPSRYPWVQVLGLGRRGIDFNYNPACVLEA
jgi:hypothetical protein